MGIENKKVTVLGSAIKENEDTEECFRVNIFGYNKVSAFTAEINDNMSWYDVLRNAAGWYLLPFYIVISKLLRRKIGW